MARRSTYETYLSGTPQNMGVLSDPLVETLLPAPVGEDDGSKGSFREPATDIRLRRDALGDMRAASAEATLAVRDKFGRWCISSNTASVVAGVVVVNKGRKREKMGVLGRKERAIWFG